VLSYVPNAPIWCEVGSPEVPAYFGCEVYMRYAIIILLAFIIYIPGFANDGSFYGSGNQLIPINETDIAVRKEILTLKRVSRETIEVTVYYEFYNPNEEKEVTVGFEAMSPAGDLSEPSSNGKGLHPYMNDFTVQMNGNILTYNVAYVTDSAYVKNGIIKSKKLSDLLGNDDANFLYVYYFKARFTKGLNVIKHTYSYSLSTSVMSYYDFDYVLTAANRWGNKQIDDFTLVVDMGEFASFHITKGFFGDKSDWLINGIGRSVNVPSDQHNSQPGDAVRFQIQKGNIIFHKANFHPVAELYIDSRNYRFEHSTQIPFSYYEQDQIEEPTTDLKKKILKNLPFARRGYIFQNTDIQKYYEKQEWYIPNPNYQPNIDLLTEPERKWINKWK